MQQQHCLFRVNVTFGSHDDGNMVRLNFTCQKVTSIEFKYVLGIILSLKSDFNNSSTPFHICSPGFRFVFWIMEVASLSAHAQQVQ